LQIDDGYLVAQLEALLAIDSPTGYTDEVVRHCTLELRRLGLEPELTRRGAIRAIRRGGRRKAARAIVAHLDTLGGEWFGATNTEGGMNPPDQSSGSTEEWSHSR